VLKNSSDKNFHDSADVDQESGAGYASVADVHSPPRFVPPAAGAVDILKLLTDLEDQVESTSRGPFGTLFRFDEDRFHMTVMKIRANLPEDLKRASRLAREMEVTSEEAREQVERAIAEGKQSARSELERARAEAAQVRERANAAAVAVELEADGAAEAVRRAAEQEALRIQQETEAESERMIDEARRTGFSMLDAAQVQAESAVAESEITRRAEARAREILEAAQAEASAVRHGADDYARDVLTNLQNVVGKALGQIEQGRTVLDRR
jgi:membrane protein involved in colicin uptake